MSGTRKRTTVSLHKELMAKAEILMQENHFSDFSSFLDQLVREAWEKRGTSGELKEKEQPAAIPSVPPNRPVNYRGRANSTGVSDAGNASKRAFSEAPVVSPKRGRKRRVDAPNAEKR